MNKMLLYMMTGDMMVLFMNTQDYFMYKMLTGGLGGNSSGMMSTAYSGTNMAQVLPLMMLAKGRGGYRRSYARPRTVVYNRRYYRSYGRRRW